MISWPVNKKYGYVYLEHMRKGVVSDTLSSSCGNNFIDMIKVSF